VAIALVLHRYERGDPPWQTSNLGALAPLWMGHWPPSQAVWRVLKRNTVYDRGLGRVQTARPARQSCLCGHRSRTQQAKGRL
jgi:hypothetical protein